MFSSACSRHPCIRDAVAAIDALHLDLGILDYSAILHVEAPDLAQVTGVSRIDSQELRDDSEPAAGVQGSVRQVETLLPQPLWVKVATVFVANALIIVWPSIRGDIAPLQTSDVAGVRGEGCCAAVGLPNIHLTAASAMLFDVRPWLLSTWGALSSVGGILGTICSTRKLAHINVEGKLPIRKRESLVSRPTREKGKRGGTPGWFQSSC